MHIHISICLIMARFRLRVKQQPLSAGRYFAKSVLGQIVETVYMAFSGTFSTGTFQVLACLQLRVVHEKI